MCRTSCTVRTSCTDRTSGVVTVVATIGGALAAKSLSVDISFFTALNMLASKSSSCQKRLKTVFC